MGLFIFCFGVFVITVITFVVLSLICPSWRDFFELSAIGAIVAIAMSTQHDGGVILLFLLFLLPIIMLVNLIKFRAELKKEVSSKFEKYKFLLKIIVCPIGFISLCIVIFLAEMWASC